MSVFSSSRPVEYYYFAAMRLDVNGFVVGIACLRTTRSPIPRPFKQIVVEGNDADRIMTQKTSDCVEVLPDRAVSAGARFVLVAVHPNTSSAR